MLSKKIVIIIIFVLFLQVIISTSITGNTFKTTQYENNEIALLYNKNACAIDCNIRSIAEYEPAGEVIITWPKWWSSTDGYNQEDYYINLTKSLEDVINVNILVNNNLIKNRVISKLEENGIPITNITFTKIFTETIWVRDYGPFFIEKNNNLEIVDFGYFPGAGTIKVFFSDLFPTRYGIKNNIRITFLTNILLTIQGGNYLTDGNGTGFICIGGIRRDNPFLPENRAIDILKRFLGLKDLIILEGQKGDFTGHIDMFAKIINESTIIVGQYTNSSDVNYQILENNTQKLADCAYNVIRIPMLRKSSNNKILTYTNSLIVNSNIKKIVLVPQYNIPEDSDAISIYQMAMPDYEIRGVNSDTIIESYGAIHCTTITLPEI